MAKPEKQAKIAELTEQLQHAQTAILTDYRGLKVKQMTELRRRVRATGAHYQVVKNTLLVRALQELGSGEAVPLIKGPLAVVFTPHDPSEVARALAAFRKEHGLPVIRGGLLSGKMLTAEQAQSLATIPPREQLLAMAVGALQAPLTGLVTTLQAVSAGLVGTLQSIAEKRGAVSAA
jgi:large subunit ribosomal protein L10